ncbi:hypothetical protein GQX74_010107 [Glossina fuscipes]|nr:hypothetical protein GQX74_010107 [Glossina fuscipes]
MIKQDTPLVIQPKTEQKVKVNFNKSVDFKKLKVSNLRCKKYSGVVFDCSGDDKRKSSNRKNMKLWFQPSSIANSNSRLRFSAMPVMNFWIKYVVGIRFQGHAGGDEILRSVGEVQSLWLCRGGGLLQVQRLKTYLKKYM